MRLASQARQSALDKPKRRYTRAAIKLLVCALLLGASLLAPAAGAAAAPGDLDPSFGNGGIAPQRGFQAESVAIQPDGKLVVAGWVTTPSGGDDFALARFNTNGTIDSTFGSSGAVTTDFGGDEQAHAVAIQADGKIVVAGGPSPCFSLVLPIVSCPRGFQLARYTTSGALDPSFGDSGKVTISGALLLGPVLQGAFDVVIQPDQKIIAVGAAQFGRFDFGVVRLNSDGSLDSRFAQGGIATVNAGGDERAFSVALQSDGKIVVGGNHDSGGMVARLSPDGALDPSFGSGGIVITPQFNDAYRAIQDLLVQPDGKIAATGDTVTRVTASNTAKVEFIVARYTSDGSLDSSFGNGGIAVTDLSPYGSDYGSASALVLQPDGKLVAAGHSATGNVALARYLPDGSLDNSFGSGGVAISERASGGESVDAVLQQDGKLVVTCCGSAARFLMASPPAATHVLTVTKAGSGSGTVTSSPAGIDCGTTCSARFEDGASITLTAEAASGSRFTGWSRACVGTGSCAVTMSADHTVTATFEPIPPPNTRITKTMISTTKRQASFYFKASGPAASQHFQCKLDTSAWKSCTSPNTYNRLARGTHIFQVRALDAQGKADPTPAKHTFTI